MPQQKGLRRLLSEQGNQRFSAFGPQVVHFYQKLASIGKRWETQACTHSCFPKSFCWPWTGWSRELLQGSNLPAPQSVAQPNTVGNHSPAQPLPGDTTHRAAGEGGRQLPPSQTSAMTHLATAPATPRPAPRSPTNRRQRPQPGQRPAQAR